MNSNEWSGKMIYCVEDDEGIRDIEVYALKSAGFEAEGFVDGESLFAAIKREKPELILLDIMLPGTDGVDILKKLKASPDTSDIAVVMATAKGTEYDKIKGLDTGADDYIVKPFGMMEMISRVRAVLRRCRPKSEAHVLKAGGLVVDLDERTVTADGRSVTLTYKEFELLCLFMKHAGMAFTRDRLFEDVWGMDLVGETRTVDMHIRTLRQKLGDYGQMIETVRGVGYRFSKSADKS